VPRGWQRRRRGGAADGTAKRQAGQSAEQSTQVYASTGTPRPEGNSLPVNGKAGGKSAAIAALPRRCAAAF
jgi:hypothetical protein